MSQIKNSYYVVDFEHIDDHRCFHSLEDEIGGSQWSDLERKDLEELRYEVGSLFRDAGWEGDGVIDCFFVPPCFCNRGDTHCSTIFHVKQDNNGTSWLAIPKGFQFELPDGMVAKAPRA